MCRIEQILTIMYRYYLEKISKLFYTMKFEWLLLDCQSVMIVGTSLSVVTTTVSKSRHVLLGKAKQALTGCRVDH